jgi:hypothetical protein
MNGAEKARCHCEMSDRGLGRSRPEEGYDLLRFTNRPALDGQVRRRRDHDGGSGDRSRRYHVECRRGLSSQTQNAGRGIWRKVDIRRTG